MRASRYNFWSETPQGVVLLYNGRSGALIALEDETEVYLAKQVLSGEQNSMFTEFERLGFLWNDEDLSEDDFIITRASQLNSLSSSLDITISPTYECNFRCTYCYVDFDAAIMTDEVENRIIDYLEDNMQHYSRLNLTWFGGEPLLQWQRVARMAAQINRIGETRGCDVEQFLTTNGYLFSPKVASTLIEAGVKWIHITIDGCDQGQDTRRVLRDGSATYHQVLDNLVHALEHHQDIGMTLRMNLDPESIALAKPLLESIPKRLRKRIQAHPTPIILEESIWDSAFYHAVAEVVTDSLSLGYSYYDNEIPVGRRFHCGAENPDNFQIGPDGRLHKCSPSNKSEVTVGVIANDGAPVFSENNIAWLAANKVADTCRRCEYLCFCLGGCRLDRLRNQSDPRCREQYSCMRQHILNRWIAANKGVLVQ